MADLVAQARLIDRRHAVSSADDGVCGPPGGGLGEQLGDLERSVDSRSDQDTYADILIGQSKEPFAKRKGALANSGNAATMTSNAGSF